MAWFYIFTATIKDVRPETATLESGERSSGAQISCSGASSSSGRACISSSGQRLQSLKSSGLGFLQGPCLFSWRRYQILSRGLQLTQLIQS